MRSVYSFFRSTAETTAALARVFSVGGTAHEQLSAHAEMLVEPVGWDALWKLSKDFCKKFEVRFPCVAYVTVTSVDFEELAACVEVQSVQHEAVSLPETVQDVPLIELWPTLKQQEQCVNAATTAEFIDLMRFFYNHIWMPWDEQDDKMLLPNTIEERMQLWTELHNGTIPNYLARLIILLRKSAIDAHERLKELDNSLCEDSGDDDDDSLLPANYITLCAELTSRLDTHLAKWTLYEKALIRKQYLAKEKAKWAKNKSKKNIVALWQGGSSSDFNQMSQYLCSHLTPEHTLTVTPSAEDALALEPEELVVCSNEYAVPEVPLSDIIISSFNGATLKSSETRSCLLNLSSTCSLRALTLQCARVNTAIVARAATLTLRHCALTDPHCAQSDFVQGIVAMPDSKLVIENTTFENFYTGIVVHKGASVELRNCTIRNCGVGVQMYAGASVVLQATSLAACSEACVRAELDPRAHTDSVEGLVIKPNCTIGLGDLQKEILIVKQDSDLI